MIDFRTLLDVLLTADDVLLISSACSNDAVVLRIFPLEAAPAGEGWRLVFDVQNVADGPLAIAPVVTATFKGRSVEEMVFEIGEADCVIAMGTTRRFAAFSRIGSDEKAPLGNLYQVHVSLAE